MSIEADLKALYTAGRRDFPAHARLVSSQCTTLRGTIDTLDRVAAHEGDSRVLTHALSVLDDVHDALRQAVETLNDCAEGLVGIADDYVRADDAAREAFRGLRDRLPDTSSPAPVPEDNSDPERAGAEETESSPEPVAPGDEKSRRDDELDVPVGPEL